jgi:hypothetical protein
VVMLITVRIVGSHGLSSALIVVCCNASGSSISSAPVVEEERCGKGLSAINQNKKVES